MADAQPNGEQKEQQREALGRGQFQGGEQFDRLYEKLSCAAPPNDLIPILILTGEPPLIILLINLMVLLHPSYGCSYT